MESDPRVAAALARLDMPELPVYLISGCPDPADPGRSAPFYTSDPGRALITGKCADLNRVKGPILRGLAARAPYFHNGAAANLAQVVSFYDERFQMQLTPEEKSDLVAFLSTL
jgi:cytochrome c peroxidase